MFIDKLDPLSEILSKYKTCEKPSKRDHLHKNLYGLVPTLPDPGGGHGGQHPRLHRAPRAAAPLAMGEQLLNAKN